MNEGDKMTWLRISVHRTWEKYGLNWWELEIQKNPNRVLHLTGSQSLIPQRIYDLIDDVIFLHLGQKRKPGIFTLGDLWLTACCLQAQNLEVFDFGGLHKYLV